MSRHELYQNHMAQFYIITLRLVHVSEVKCTDECFGTLIIQDLKSRLIRRTNRI